MSSNSFWQGRKVFVTGCSGLIGGPMCRMFLNEGAELVGYDLERIGTLPAHGIHGQFPVIHGDILYLSDLVKAMRGHEVVIHLAAVSGVEHARQLGAKAIEINTVGTLKALEAARQTGVQATIVASSNHVYGRQLSPQPTGEDAPMNQLDTYSVSKICGDVLARAWAHNYGLNVAIIRNTNCYGPGDPHRDHIIPGTILSLLEGKAPVIRSNGVRRKAYLYVDDVAGAYLAVAKFIAQAQGSVPKAFNVSTESISVLQLVEAIREVMGSELQPEILNQPDDQSDEFLDSSLIRHFTGWEPQHSLEEGLTKTIAWFRDKVHTAA